MPFIRAIGSSGNTWEIVPVPLRVSRSLNEAQADLYAVANALFGCESLVEEGKDVKRLEIPCYRGYDSGLADTLEKLFYLVLSQPIRVTLTENTQVKLFSDNNDEPLSGGYTCLFSTGLDSYSAILNAGAKFNDLVGCFVSHHDQRKLQGLANQFSRHVSAQTGVHVARISAMNHGQFMRRSRGIFYIFYGLLLGRKNVIMGEAGATMYQPKLTILDEITITTHPLLLRMVGEVTRAMLGDQPKIIIPCEDMTKAEVVASCPDQEWIKKTFSCSGTTRFATEDVANCGTCFACVVRRLSVLVSGKKDSKYGIDIAGDWNTPRGYDNALHLLRFSLDFLDDRDAVPWYTSEILYQYGKADLFERFAMDNLAGLLLLSDRTGLNHPLQKMLDQAKIGKEALRERIAVVQSERHKLDFTKIV